MDSLTELFAYFDDHITDLPFYYPKKPFFRELKNSTTNAFLKYQSQNWFSFRLREYCQERGYQLHPQNKSQRRINGKMVDFIFIEKEQ
jgi:hypothetical protein